MLSLLKSDNVSIMEFINSPPCYKVGKINFYGDYTTYNRVRDVFNRKITIINLKLRILS